MSKRMSLDLRPSCFGKWYWHWGLELELCFDYVLELTSIYSSCFSIWTPSKCAMLITVMWSWHELIPVPINFPSKWSVNASLIKSAGIIQSNIKFNRWGTTKWWPFMLLIQYVFYFKWQEDCELKSYPGQALKLKPRQAGQG